MKILRFEADGRKGYGILQEDGSILKLMGSPYGEFQIGRKVAELGEVRVLAPVAPAKVVGVGLNYVSHIKESGKEQPGFPMLFMKPSTAVIGPTDPIVYPEHVEQVEYEAELTAVIGRPCKQVAEEEALNYVLGYTCGNDVTERIVQKGEMAMGALLVCKGFDTFCPLGPVIETEVDPTDLGVMARVNGEEVQTGHTSDLLFSVAQLVSYLSQSVTLLPGDVILTGTPSGVGPIEPGDTVEIEIEGVGVLENPVVLEQ